MLDLSIGQFLFHFGDDSFCFAEFSDGADQWQHNTQIASQVRAKSCAKLGPKNVFRFQRKPYRSQPKRRVLLGFEPGKSQLISAKIKHSYVRAELSGCVGKLAVDLVLFLLARKVRQPVQK